MIVDLNAAVTCTAMERPRWPQQLATLAVTELVVFICDFFETNVVTIKSWLNKVEFV